MSSVEANAWRDRMAMPTGQGPLGSGKRHIGMKKRCGKPSCSLSGPISAGMTSCRQATSLACERRNVTTLGRCLERSMLMHASARAPAPMVMLMLLASGTLGLLRADGGRAGLGPARADDKAPSKARSKSGDDGAGVGANRRARHACGLSAPGTCKTLTYMGGRDPLTLASGPLAIGM